MMVLITMELMKVVMTIMVMTDECGDGNVCGDDGGGDGSGGDSDNDGEDDSGDGGGDDDGDGDGGDDGHSECARGGDWQQWRGGERGRVLLLITTIIIMIIMIIITFIIERYVVINNDGDLYNRNDPVGRHHWQTVSLKHH